MASTAEKRMYQEADLVDEYLLNQVSKWILFHRLPSLARDLGISQAEFSRIAIPSCTPEEQIFQVLHKWQTKSRKVVADLVSELVKWTERGYLDRGIWTLLSSKIDATALPANLEKLQLTPISNPQTIMDSSYVDLSIQSGTVLRRRVTRMVEEVTFREANTTRLENVPRPQELVEPREQSEANDPVDISTLSDDSDDSEIMATAPSAGVPSPAESPIATQRDAASSQGPKRLTRANYIQVCLKESLIQRYGNFMSIDWLPHDETRRFPDHVYTEPCWTRTVRGHLWDRRVELKHLYELFDLFKENSRVLAEGGAGSGKSSAMVKLSLDWAKRRNRTAIHSEDHSQSDVLRKRFDYVFLVPLKNVDSDISMEQLILQEHELENKSITVDEIKSITDSPRCLLILDGYDEYKKGTNSDIDASISGKKINSFVLITSRPDHMEKEDKRKLDAEIQNNGLRKGSIQECTQRYIEDEENAKDFLEKAVKQGLVGLLKVPILLLMMCVLYLQTGFLPKKRGQIVRDIVDMYILRAQERGVYFEDTDKILLDLGELSFEASRRNTHQLLIKKSDIESKSRNILKLGLLQGDMSPQKAHTGTAEQPEWWTFPHKIFQDYFVALFIEEQGEEGINLMYIPYTWRNVFRHTWKVMFLINILDDDVAHFVWEMTTKRWLYRYHYMRRCLMMSDRWTDIEYTCLFVLYYRESFPRWHICLGLYITLRLISFALYSNTKLFKCYAVRTVLPTVISGVFCSVALVPCIFAWKDDVLVILPVCECLAKCIGHLVILIQVYKKLWTLDSDNVLERQEDCWVYRYQGNRRGLLFWDRLCDIFVIGLVIFYHLKSIPHWPFFLTLCIFLRVISFTLYSNIITWKCYAVRTVFPTILSVLSMTVVLVPCILDWIEEAIVILPFCMFLAYTVPYVSVLFISCRKYR